MGDICLDIHGYGLYTLKEENYEKFRSFLNISTDLLLRKNKLEMKII